MHLLDFFFYPFLVMILWFLIDKFSGGELTQELGSLGGIFIVIIFTILYIVLFAIYPDWNWIDILNNLNNQNIHITL